MKLHQLPLLILLFTTPCMSMQPQLHTIPNVILLYIAALAQNKPAMNLVSKQCANVITQENMLLNFPKSLSKRDHINFMVKAAKKDDEKKIRLGLKTASKCRHNYTEILRSLLPGNSPLLTPAIQFSVSLWYEQNGNEKYFQELLPTIIAVYKGDQTVIDEYKNKLLLDYPRNKERLTALHIATHLDEPDIAELLLAQNPTLLHQYPSYLHAPRDPLEEKLAMAIPLEVAIKKNLHAMYELLLSFKNIHPDPSLLLDKKLTNYQEFTFLEWVISQINLPLIKLVVNQLKQQYCQEKYISFFTPRALNLAIGAAYTTVIPTDCYEIILFLLEEIAYKLPGKTQPLHIAVEKDNHELIKIICDHPTTNINAQNEYGSTSLLTACMKNNLWASNYLLTRNADPTIPDTSLRTPLSIAAWYTNVSLIQLLLTITKAGDTINIQDIEGKTPLMLSTRYFSPQTTTLLLDAGADRDIRDNNDNTAYDLTDSDTIKQLLTSYNPSKK